MNIIMMVAMSNNRVIGNEGKIPWHLGTDLQRFKQITMNGCLLMGSKTFESIGRVLPGRLNIVLSRTKDLMHYHDYRKNDEDRLIVVNSVDQALILARTTDNLYVIGGEEIYNLFMDIANKMYLSILPDDYEGDTFFPEVDLTIWNITDTELVKDELTYYKFVQLERRV